MSDTFSELNQQFTEIMARLFETEGLSPLVGRIFSQLMVSPDALSIQEVAERLGITKAAVSIHVRMLEREGVCLKLARSSDRKDYYHISENFSETFIRSTVQKIHQSHHLFGNFLDQLPKQDQISEEDLPSFLALKERLTELCVLYEIFSERMNGIEEECKRRLAQIRAKIREE